MDVTLALDILARVGGDDAPTAAELTTARDTIARELHRLRSEGGADLEALMSLREAYTTAAAAVTEAEEAEAAADQELDQVLDGIPNPDTDPGPDTEGGEVADDTPVAAGASGHVLSITEALDRLGLRTPNPDTDTADTSDRLAATRTTVTLGSNVHDDGGVTWRDLADTFKLGSRSLREGKTVLASINTEFAEERTLPGKIDGNTRLIDSFVSPEAVTAAGGCCSLPTPIYENPVAGSTARPIRDALPTVGVQQRGQVMFYPAICLPDQGAAIWTCDDDDAVDADDPTTWKQCLDIDCDEEQRADIDAIYACTGVGNYLQRYSPEQWQGRLQALSVFQARMAEVALFDKMRAEVTTSHTADPTGSFYATLVNAVALAAATIRQDQRLIDVQLNLVLADWVRSAVREDLRSRRIGAADDIEVADQVLTQTFDNEGVTVIWSPDIDPIEPDGQTDGPLTDYPDTASTVLFPDGYFSYLDGGTLDLGTDIRDMEANRQNKVYAFAESWEGLLARGCNAKALDVPVDVCSDVPCAVAGS